MDSKENYTQNTDEFGILSIDENGPGTTRRLLQSFGQLIKRH